MRVSVGWIITNYFFKTLPFLPYAFVFRLTTFVVLEDEGIKCVNQGLNLFFGSFLDSVPIH